MARPTREVADVFRRYGDVYRQQHALSPTHRRVMRAIETCRTAALGGHVEQCDACGHQRIAYNSCANRHCPKCQSLARAAWVEQRTAELLDVPYFHVVFTLPEVLGPIALQNKVRLYGLLFHATAETLQTIAADPRHFGAEIGFFAVLHTWGSTLVHHPHLHCVVPGGGLALDRTRWISCRPDFFLSVRVLSRLFRRLFLQALHTLYETGQLRLDGRLESLRNPHAWAQLIAYVRRSEWVVYAKRPFAGPQQVLEYVGRYTHRVALSNDRLVEIDRGHVRFTYKNYRADPPQVGKTMTLAADEFIRRFLLHVLPPGFHRIRHYGFLGARHRRTKLPLCRQLIGSSVPIPPPPPVSRAAPNTERIEVPTGISLRTCPACHQGQMIVIERLRPIAVPVCSLDTS